MAKSWKEVIQSDQYLSLNPEQQAQAQEQYFNEVVAPQLQGADIEEAKNQFYTAYPATQKGNAVDAVVEPLTSIGAGVVGEIGAGLGGIYELIKTGDIDSAANAVNQMRANISERFAPETEAGRRGLENVAETVQAAEENIIRPAVAGTAGLANIALNPIENITQGFEPALQEAETVKEQGLGKAAGQEVLNETGSPLLATLAETFAETAPDVATGLFSLSKIKPVELPEVKFLKNRSKVQDELANRIRSGSADKDLVDKMVNESGRVVTDNIAKETIKQGFDEGVIAAVKGASKQDKSRMLQMVNVLEKGKNNALYAAKNRPADIAGDSLLKEVRFIKKLNSDAGIQLNRVANTLKGKPVDVSEPIDNFISDLDSMGVSINENMVPSFEGSTIETIAPAKKLVKDVLLKVRRNPNMDAKQAHDFKKFIDENVTFGKQAKGLGGKAESIAKKLRSSVNESIGGAYPEYAQANKQFSDTISAIDNLQSASGSKVNLFGPQSDKALGTTLRRLMNNTQARVNLMDSIQEIKNVSGNYGGSFDDDVFTQMLFADELDSMFGSSPRTSLAGQVEKGTRRALETAEGGAFRATVDLVAEGAEKLRGINEENAIKSIKELLKEK